MTQKLVFISLIGITPKAVANSIYWCIEKTLGWHPNLSWDFVAIQTETSTVDYEDVISLLMSYKDRYESSKSLTEPSNVNKIYIPEADLVSILDILSKELEPIIKEHDGLILFDVTPGRKIMSVSLTLSALRFLRAYPSKSLKIVYYLLKNMRELSSKDAPELYPDEIEVFEWPVGDILDLVM